MARTRKSSKTDKEVVRRTVDGLKHPFPAKPGEGRYVIYCDKHNEGEELPRVLVQIFAQAYAGARLIRALIGKDTYEECDPVGTRTGIITSGGVKITGFHNIIQELLDYEPTEAEAEWRDERIEQTAARFRFGSSWNGRQTEVIEEQVEDEETGELVTRKIKAPKGKKETKPKAEKKPKIDRSGMVTAADLAARLKIEPRIFRGALRSLKKVKPEGGWLWSKDDAEEVFKEVTKELGKDEKKKGKKQQHSDQ